MSVTGKVARVGARGRTGGLPDKRRAILSGALTLFARDGYTRTSLDAIAAAAGVSNRTIYNHFSDKAELFQAVIQDSSQRVADAQIAIIDRHLSKVVDLEADLVAFGLDWLAVLDSDVAPHFALVRQIRAEIEHIPRAAVEAWQRSGPCRVCAALADRLRRLTGAGLPPLPDPKCAAVHLMQLISVDNLPEPEARHDRRRRAAMVAAGVHTFLYGYRTGPAPQCPPNRARRRS